MAHLYRTLRMCALQRRRGSGVVSRSGLFKPVRKREPAPNVRRSNWGLHEKYHQKQTLGWSFAVAGRIGHRRRSDLPERSQAERAGRGGRRSARRPLPVSVSVVAPRQTVPWDEFSGRLEAVERVEVRSRVAGAVQAVHFREGALVKQGDLLITIDPAPYAAEVERAEGAGRRGAGARDPAPRASSSAASSLTERARSRSASSTSASTPTARPKPTCAPPQAALQTAQLNLGYTAGARAGRRAASASSRSRSATWSPPAPARRC